MSAATISTPHQEVGPRPYRFTVGKYERLAEAGILTADDRVELIGGEIIAMSPIGIRHAGCVIGLTDLLGERVGSAVSISVQNPLWLSETDQPQPDLVLLRRGHYQRTRPTPDRVLLLIEVMDSSRDYDRIVKLPLYAAAGIPEVWLVDLVADVIECYTEPRGGRYHRMALFARGDTLTATTLPALAIAVDDVLG